MDISYFFPIKMEKYFPARRDFVLVFQKSQIFSSLHTNQLKNGSYSRYNVVCIKSPLITDYN